MARAKRVTITLKVFMLKVGVEYELVEKGDVDFCRLSLICLRVLVMRTDREGAATAYIFIVPEMLTCLAQAS